MHGSGYLVRWLFANDLVDEFTLLTYPVVVGQGTRLFPATGPDEALDLVQSRSTPRGATIQVYRPPGTSSTQPPPRAWDTQRSSQVFFDRMGEAVSDRGGRVRCRGERPPTRGAP